MQVNIIAQLSWFRCDILEVGCNSAYNMYRVKGRHSLPLFVSEFLKQCCRIRNIFAPDPYHAVQFVRMRQKSPDSICEQIAL